MHRSKKTKPVPVKQQPVSTIVTEPSTSAASLSSSSSSSLENNLRYFVNSKREPINSQKCENSANDNSIAEGSSSGMLNEQNQMDSVAETIDEPKPFSQRKKLGKLPSFIPID